VSEGSYVSPQSRIASLQSLEQVKVDFAVPEKYAGDVRAGQAIRFQTAHSSEVHAGRIYAIEPKIDPLTRTVQIRALSPNPGGRILPGSFAQVELILSEDPNALLVPTEALVPELKGQKVFVAVGGKAFPRFIETGLRTEHRIQVTSGLSAGDTVITSGILQLAEGMPVAITVLQ
jgi:membrane fusion protein (multidrug efflux system)